MFEGSYVALATPFRNGGVDYEKLEQLIEMHAQNSTAGLAPCGTTGESPTLSHQEHKEVIAFVVKKAAGRLPVIAGTGSNSTAEAVELTIAAAKAGAQATLQVSPYYNKPEPDGMFGHFKAIADAAHLPMILYNVPSRTSREIALETIFRLAEEVQEVVAVKAAGGSMNRVSEVCSKTRLDVLSGDDSMTLPMMAIGAKGVISVVANFIPRDVATMVAAGLKGDCETARELHLKMYPIFKAAFCEIKPDSLQGHHGTTWPCSAETRSPLSALRPANRARVEQALRDYGLLK